MRFAELGVSRLVGLVLFCAGLAFPARAGACSCRRMSSEELIAAAGVAFVARVERVEPVPDGCPVPWLYEKAEFEHEIALCSEDAKADPKCEEVLQAAQVPGALEGLRSTYCQTKVELSVLTQYKGRVPASLWIDNADSGARCGVAFAPQQEWLVLADAAGSEIITSGCHGTQPLARADELLRLLRGDPSGRAERRGCHCRVGKPIGGASSLGAALAALLPFAARRRLRK